MTVKSGTAFGNLFNVGHQPMPACIAVTVTRPAVELLVTRPRGDQRSSSLVTITGMAFGWIGATTELGDVVRKP